MSLTRRSLLTGLAATAVAGAGGIAAQAGSQGRKPRPSPSPTSSPSATPTPSPTPSPIGSTGIEPHPVGSHSLSEYLGARVSDRNASIPAGTVVTVPPVVYEDADMNTPSNYPVYCFFLSNPGQLLGSGIDSSVFKLKANSLTQGYVKISSITEPNVNPYQVFRTDRATLCQDFTIIGTAQGIDPTTGKEYSYHGWQVYGTANPTIRRVKIFHIPGSKGVPPNETFPLYFYQCSGLITVEDVILDGDGVASSGVSGQPKAGTGLAIDIKRLTIKGGPNGAGWTCFNRAFTSIRSEDMHTDGSLVGMNFEQVVVNGGAAVNNTLDSGIVLIRPDFRNPSNAVYPGQYSHLSIDSSVNGTSVPGVSNRVDIHDPVGIDAAHPFGITISSTYGYYGVPSGAQAQRGADIHLWMGTTERPDLIKWLRTKGAA